MQRLIKYSLVSVLALACLAQMSSAESPARWIWSRCDQSARVSQSPLFFEQAPSEPASAAKYFSRGPNYLFGIASDHAQIVLVKANLDKSDGLPGRGITGYDDVSIRQLELDFVGSNPNAEVSGAAELPRKVNYFIGNDPAKWRAASMFSNVRVSDLYPGISMIYYGNGERFEYDFELQPGADPRQIAIRIQGADSLRVDAQGDLVIDLAGEQIRQAPPQIYQIINGMKQPVSGRYHLEADNVVQIQVDQYNPGIPLTIDPQLSYSSYFGGKFGDRAYAIKVDPSGNVYIAGQSVSPTFLFTNPPALSLALTNHGGKINGDAFVARLGATAADPPAYFTFLGGSGNDGANDLALDPSGHVYVTGFTGSPDFPTNFPTPLTADMHGLSNQISGVLDPKAHIYATDVFVSELDTTVDGPASLMFSAYLGGTRVDVGIGIALNSAGDIFLTGYTDSTNFPTWNGFQTNGVDMVVTLNSHNQLKTNYYGRTNDVFVTRLNPTDGIVYSSYLGGTNNDVGQGIAALDNLAFVTGYTASTNFPITPDTAFSIGLNHSSTNSAKLFHKRVVPLDAFIAEFDTSQTGLASLPFCSYFGGSNSDAGYRIVVDTNKQVYITGNTTSRDFPRSTNANLVPISYGLANSNVLNYDAILAKFDFTDPAHPTNLWSFSFGGHSDDVGWDLALDQDNDIFVVGATISPHTNFPTSGTNVIISPLTRTNRGGASVFVTAFGPDAQTLLYSTLLGGKLNDYGFAIAVDANKTAYITGETFTPKGARNPTNFPVTITNIGSVQPGPLQTRGAGTNDAFLAAILLNPLTNSPPPPPPP